MENIVDVTGAGDAFVSATLHAWLNGDVIATASTNRYDKCQ